MITVIQKQLAKVIIEYDSLVTIEAINGDITPLSCIRNLVEDINILSPIRISSLYTVMGWQTVWRI